MSSNCVLVGWNRSVPGREMSGAQHFQEFTEYLGAQQGNGAITSFEAVFMDPHGGDMNGFFLIRGEPQKLQALLAGDDWLKHQVRGIHNMQGFGVIRAATGAEVPRRMQMWVEMIPK
jgi:hypothetical protein